MIFAQIPDFTEGGMAAVAAALFVLVVWLVKRLLQVLDENNKVISGNTEVLKEAVQDSAEHRRLLSSIKDELISRPCLLEDSKFQLWLKKVAIDLTREVEIDDHS